MIIINKIYLMFEEFKEQNQNIGGTKRIGLVKNALTGDCLTEMSVEDFKKTISTCEVFVEIPNTWEKKHSK